jgi:hypothetical protein
MTVERLYFLFSDVRTAEKAVDELLLQRVDIHHMHTIAKDGMDIGKLPEATVLQKCDIRHSLLLGIPVGAVLGIGTGLAFHAALNMEIGGLMVATTIFGAILGGWFASMVGLLTTNTAVKPFEEAIERGQILLLVDIPYSKLEQVEHVVGRVDPKAEIKDPELIA